LKESGMTTTVWGRVLLGVYTFGYWIYLIVVSVSLWPTLNLWDWSTQITLHSFLGLVWPITFPLWLKGYF
jgi:hypothetical protein